MHVQIAVINNLQEDEVGVLTKDVDFDDEEFEDTAQVNFYILLSDNPHQTFRSHKKLFRS
jgi:hypothetical protein